MAVKTDGSLWGWGDNGYDKVAYGALAFRMPIKIMDDVASVSAGADSTMAVKTDGSLWAWGRNDYGQLGDGTTENDGTPVKIMDDVVSVSVGTQPAMAIKTDGSLWSWGIGDYELPAKVMDGVASVSKGANDFWMVIRTDGSLWAWGNDGHGQLGVGIGDSGSSIPIKVMDGVASVSTGAYHTVAVKTDGSLWSWGRNQFGELGQGTLEYKKNTPVKIMDGVASVSAGYAHCLAVKTDGSLWAWGGNFYGEIGDGSCSEYYGYYYNFAWYQLEIIDDHNKLSPVRIMGGVKLPGAPPIPINPGITLPYPIESLDSADDWARAEIASAIEKGFVPQEIQGDYKNVITRLEFCRMAVKFVEYRMGESIETVMAEKGVSRDPNAFTDTGDPDILAAFALGITTGTGNNQFTPGGQITRQQAATMIRRVCGVVGVDIDYFLPSGFEDLNQAASWAIDAIDFCRSHGIMQGVSSTEFSPLSTYTRQQSIATFDRLR